MISDEGAQQEPREPPADCLLEPGKGARTGGVETLDRGAVLEEEHRTARRVMRLSCGGGHALFVSTQGGVPLHP